jgi:aspartate carbamoyltransferase catalytic subunit
MPHLLSITDLNRETIVRLLDRAEELLHTIVKQNGQLPLLTGQVVANLFFEPSTRTQYSFSIAAQRLGAWVLDPHMDRTSTVKGESLLDTVRTFIAMGSRLIIIRHKKDKISEELADEIQNQACIINAGDGCHQHPTQALLDLLTIRQHKGEFSNLKVAIIGDIAHSRVARSLVDGLTIMGCTHLNLIAPPEFLPADISLWPVKCFTTLEEGLAGADIIVALRFQWERMMVSSPEEFSQLLGKYQLNEENLRFAHPQARVMHPGPINRGIEITSAVADGPQSILLQQITNGVAVRMAVIEWLLAPGR